jgi:hypothetical protein
MTIEPKVSKQRTQVVLPSWAKICGRKIGKNVANSGFLLIMN